MEKSRRPRRKDPTIARHRRRPVHVGGEHVLPIGLYSEERLILRLSSLCILPRLRFLICTLARCLLPDVGPNLAVARHTHVSYLFSESESLRNIGCSGHIARHIRINGKTLSLHCSSYALDLARRVAALDCEDRAFPALPSLSLDDGCAAGRADEHAHEQIGDDEGLDDVPHALARVLVGEKEREEDAAEGDDGPASEKRDLAAGLARVERRAARAGDRLPQALRNVFALRSRGRQERCLPS